MSERFSKTGGLVAENSSVAVRHTPSANEAASRITVWQRRYV